MRDCEQWDASSLTILKNLYTNTVCWQGGFGKEQDSENIKRGVSELNHEIAARTCQQMWIRQIYERALGGRRTLENGKNQILFSTIVFQWRSK